MRQSKCILITGAASGIGRATALYFSRKGWFAGIFDLDAEGLSGLAREIGPDRCLAKVMDVTKVDEVKAAVGAFGAASQGRLDVLFNNAGIIKMGPFIGNTLEEHHKIVDVNVKGILTCTHLCLEMLKNTPRSRVINMSSASAVYGTPELAVYSAAKFAVRGLTEALNLELEKEGVWVTDIMAPYVNTPMVTASAVKAASVERLGVKLKPEDVAEVVYRAAQGKKVHWPMTLSLKLLLLLHGWLPFARRSLVKAISMK